MEETNGIDLPNTFIVDNIMSKRGSSNKFNNNGSKMFLLIGTISKEACAALNPESKYFLNSVPAKKKAFMLGSEINKTNHKHSFTIKSKNEIEALFCQSLTFEENVISKVDTTSEDSIEWYTSILFNCTTTNSTNPTDARNLISTVYERRLAPKPKLIKLPLLEKN